MPACQPTLPAQSAALSRRAARTPLAAAVAAALLHIGSAHAQAAAPEDGLQFDRVVITGTSVVKSKLASSVSVSTLDSEQLQKTGAASAAEVLRSIPGVRAESSGGEGNANITVRGVPISAGGSRYVQLQEDGLPLLLVGDVSFATADQFLRADGFVQTLQVVRGGSASTLATNSPGGIINFISKTGKEAGGSVAYGVGLDHRQQRLDFDYGGKLADKLYFQIGGFQRTGEGTRNTDVTAENGGQVRLSLTKEFDKGYIRFSAKSLNDRTPTYLPVPVSQVGGKLSELPGIDPRKAFFINSNLPQDVTVDVNGNRKASNPADGLNVSVNSFGVEAQFKLDGGLTVTERFRRSAIGGRFIGLFPAGAAPTAVANGADRYTGSTPVFSAHIFNTSLDDMGNTFNDLRLQKVLALGADSSLTLTGGLFTGVQRVAQTWYWNRYNVGLNGDGAKFYDNAGNVSTNPVGNATTTWGGCCFRAIDVSLNATAPYAALTYDAGPLSLDASARLDKQRASGWQIFGGTAGANAWDSSRRSVVSYKTDATSYSLGGNYRINKDFAGFARASKGSSWASPDRVIWDTDVSSGRKPYPINETSQLEAGLKLRAGNASAFVTLFSAKTKEDGGFEVTTQKYLKDAYTARGVEAELSYRLGELQLAGGATLTSAKVDATGKKPRRQAGLVWQLAPSWRFGAGEVGASVIATTKSFADNDNTVTLPGYTTVNAFANYEVAAGLTLQVGVNNLFNSIGYTEAEGQGNLNANPIYVARSINGRSAKASLRYAF